MRIEDQKTQLRRIIIRNVSYPLLILHQPLIIIYSLNIVKLIINILSDSFINIIVIILQKSSSTVIIKQRQNYYKLKLKTADTIRHVSHRVTDMADSVSCFQF